MKPVSMPMSKWWAIRIRLCLVSALLAPAIHVLSSTLAPLAGTGILGSNYEWHGSFVVVHAFVLDTNVHTPRRIRAPSSRAIDDGADFFHREWTTPSIPAWRRIPTLSQSDFASRKIARRAKRKDVEPEPDPQADAVSRSELGQKFADLVEEALREETFVSLVLRGPKKPKKKKKGNSQDNSNSEDLRGSIRQVLGRLIRISSPKHKRGRRRSKKPSSGGGGNDDDDSTTRVVMQLTVKYHGATDICKNFPLSEVPKTIYDLVVGDPAEMASEWGVEAVRAQSIRSAQMVAVDKICDLISPGETGTIGTIRTQTVQNTDGSDAASSSASSSASAIATSHDRVKQVPLSNRAEFFQRLGVTRDDGQPKPRMKGKLRQCQKFVEIVGRIVDDCQKQEQKSISVVDMGCGRAYLTFSLHSYLHDRYGSVTTTGIDVRPKLVAEISGIARSLGESFDSLNFEEGTIEQVVAETSALGSRKEKDNDDNDDDDDDDDSLSVLVALHACDTATDDALYSGIAQNANVIVVAPCCHKQVRPQLNAHFSSTRQTHALSSILKHGVYRERMSETVTDSLRALLLEFAGYKVQVFEFIGGEHTSKNVMITAIKSNQKLAKSDTESIRQQIMALAGLHGISRQKLARWMDFDLGGDHADQDRPSGKRKVNQVSKLRMPPARL